MAKKWTVKSEEIKKLIYSSKENIDPRLEFIFKNKEPIIRVRNKTREEKIMEAMKMYTINTYKWAKSLKKGKDKASGIEKDIDSERKAIIKEIGKTDGSEIEKDSKTKGEIARMHYRRQITFTFRREYLSEFISIMQALNFEELGGFEHFGRRDCDYTMAVDVDEKHRLHLRAYIIKDIVYVLAHYEPKADEDVGLHIKGFFDRVDSGQEQSPRSKPNSQYIKDDQQTQALIKAGLLAPSQKNENDISQNSSNIKKNGESTATDEFGRAELSDYILGGQIILDVLETRVPNFYQKISTTVSREDLSIWIDTLGPIDHLPLDVLLSEALFDSSLYEPPFGEVKKVLQRMFSIFGFEIKIAWDTKIPPSDNYFLAVTKEKPAEIQILVVSLDFNRDLLQIVGSLNWKYKTNHTLILVPDYQIDGPSDIYQPPKDPSYSFNQDEVNHIVNFFTDKGFSVMKVTDFIYLFKNHVDIPFNQYEIAKLFEQHGLIRRKHIDNLIEARDFKTMSFNYGKSIVEIIKEEDKAIGLKNILKNLHKKHPEIENKLTMTELTRIITMLESPIIGLIVPTDDSRSKYRIKDADEEIIENKIQKFLNSLNIFYKV